MLCLLCVFLVIRGITFYHSDDVLDAELCSERLYEMPECCCYSVEVNCSY